MGFFETFNQRRNPGLMGFSQGMLQAGAPSRTPVGFAQALGMGLQGMQQAQDTDQERQIKEMMLQAQMAKASQPDLPQGYRWNPQTNQAEGVPGVDQSYLKKSDPYAMPMPVMLPNGQTAFAPKGDVIKDPTAFKPIPTEGQQPFKRENALRDEVNSLTKDFRNVTDAYTKIGSTSDSAAGDLSLLYQYNKLLDPGSVVRESEFATVAASGSLGERLQGAAQRVVSGERLTPDQRKAFKDEAQSIYKAHQQGYDRIKQNYTGIATGYGLDPKNVIVDYALPAEPATAPKVDYKSKYGLR